MKCCFPKLIRHTIPIIIFAVVFAGAAGYRAAGEELFADRPWLGDASAFVQEVDFTGGPPPLYTVGGFGIGSGYIFAIEGVDFPQNTLTNIVGPDYEKSESVRFHRISMFLDRDFGSAPARLETASSRLYRVSGTSIVVAEENMKDAKMQSVTFSPFGGTVIYRIVSITNTSNGTIDNLSLAVEAATKQEKANAGDGTLVQVTGGRRMVIGAISLPAGEPSAEPGILEIPVGQIDAGESATLVLYVSIVNDGNDPEPPAGDMDSVLEQLDAHREDWSKWLEGTIRADATDPKLADLFENTLVLLRVQTPAGVDGIAVMARYSGMWCRDTFGPVRYLLAAGKYGKVRSITKFYDLATRLVGFRNRYPVDLDLDSAPDSVDWDSLTPQQGDDPNLLIIQYYHYYRATGDIEYIRDHYGFLRRNLTGQDHDDYRLPFHSDETYQVFVMMAESATMHDFYSADTGFEFTVAAAALSEIAEALGEKEDAETFARWSRECREKTEEYYWSDERGYYIPYVRKGTLEPAASPFANIDLRPLWIGYAAASDPRQRLNVINTGKALMNKHGTMKSTARAAYYTGMAPGLLLYNLKAIGVMDRADMAYRGLMGRVMSPTGEFAEAYDGKDRWMDYAAEPNIYRPWETSINTEAVLYYVTGIKYDHLARTVTLQPYLPPGNDFLKLDNIHAGPFTFSMYLERENDVQVNVEIVNHSDRDMNIELLTEPVYGVKPPQAAESFQSGAYRRKLLRDTRVLKPGEGIVSPCGVPE